MSYWNKSLYREMLTARVNSMLTDLTNEVDKLSVAYTAFSNLRYQSISNSPSISVIRSIAEKYQTVIDGFMTAADYDAADCRALLGYIGEEEEDLIFGELHGNWEVAKQNRDNTQSELNTYQRNSTYTTSYTDYDALGNEITITEDHYPDPIIENCYLQLIDDYQAEMDAWQAKLDRLGAFEDRSGALFANSVDFRTNAIKAMNDLKDCVSSDGTFNDLCNSSALDNIDKLHAKKQKEYYNQWIDASGDPDIDAIEAFLFQNPDSVTMDQKLAFCALMDDMSDEQMTDMMNRSTRVAYDREKDLFYIEVSQNLQDVADLNSAIWCAKYSAAGYSVDGGFDEEAMNRAIAIKYAAKQLVVMAQEETDHIETEDVYKHLPVYVEGSCVYIFPRLLNSDVVDYACWVGADDLQDGVKEKCIDAAKDAVNICGIPFINYAADIAIEKLLTSVPPEGAGSSDLQDGVTEIFKKIIKKDTNDFSPYMNEWVVIKVDNNSSDDYVEGEFVAAVFDTLNESEGTDNKITTMMTDKIFGEILTKMESVIPGSFVVSPALDFCEFYAEVRKDYLKTHTQQEAEEALSLDLYRKAICLDGTFITFTGPGLKAGAITMENEVFNSGELQLAVAAYNENNEGTDIDINWIYNYMNMTEEQKEEVNKYVEWFHKEQKGHYEGTIEEYRDRVNKAYDDIKKDNNGITNAPSFDKLTPAQFKEVQNYMADPENYQVDTTVWE